MLGRMQIDQIIEQIPEFGDSVSLYQLNLAGADPKDCEGTPGYRGLRAAFCVQELLAYRDTLPDIKIISVDELEAGREGVDEPTH